MRRLRFPLAALLAAAALVVAGCGSSATVPAAPQTPTAAGETAAAPPPAPTAAAKQAVAAALAKTEAASADVEVRVVLRKPGASHVLAYDATGVIVPGGGRLRIDRTSIGDEVVQEIFTRPAGHLVLYTSSPNTSKELPKGKTWLKVDMAKYGERRYGADTSFLAGADQDPLQALRLTQSAAAKVTDLGEDWLPDRTLNRRYRAKVSIIAAAKAAGVKGKGLQALTKDLGNPTQTIDVWVSKKGYVARTVVKGPEKTSVGTLQLQETTDFTKYGTKADVQAPPAAKTADYFELTAK